MSNPIQSFGLITLAFLLLKFLFFVSCQATNFSFPDFNGTEANRLVMLGDAMSQNASVYLNRMFYSNATQYSCGKVMYPDGVRMQDPASGQVASFNTSFTFEFMLNKSVDMLGRYRNSDGFAFLFTTDATTIAPSGEYVGGEILCVEKSSSRRLFAVEVDTWLNKIDSDPSDSHIGVDVNSVVHNAQATAFVYNLCQFDSQNSSYCGYFGNDTGPFTIWIDYDGTMQVLDVRFAPSGLTKPGNASIHITKLDLSMAMNEFMYVGFSGSFGVYKEAHRISSWSFSSSGLSSTSEPDASRLNSVGLISGILVACGTVGVILAIFCYCGRRKSERRGKESTLRLHLMGPRIFTYRELSKATKDFSESEMLGSGGFGVVYKGTLALQVAPGQTTVVVAVKRCTKPGKAHAEEGFVAEATSISQIRHRNLVQLQGWCEERGELLLVYDYMPNRSLNAWLYSEVTNVLRSWELRHNILAGVAAALAYLHEEWQQCVLHRDIKSSNVLLDGDFNAHLGDFGLARLIDHHKAEKTTMMAGTLGYMAPEMSYTGKASKETDVYSFGVLTLEVVCGKRPLDVRLNPADGVDGVLVDCVWRAHETRDLLSVVDPRLDIIAARVSNNAVAVDEEEEEEGSGSCSVRLTNSVEDVLRLGLLCCQLNPSKRPSMRLVNQMLQTGDGAALPPLPATKPPMPYAFFESDITHSSITSSSSTGSPQKYDLSSRI